MKETAELKYNNSNLSKKYNFSPSMLVQVHHSSISRTEKNGA